MLAQRELYLRCSNLIIKFINTNHRLHLSNYSVRPFHKSISKPMKPHNPHIVVTFLNFHATKSNLIEEKKDAMVSREHFFHQVQKKDRETYLRLLDVYEPHDTVRRGHVEFIYAALKSMDDYGIEGDLEVYKKLLNVFPKGKFIPKSLLQAEFFHFARNQECALYVLDKMEYSGICPDKEVREIILSSFGMSSHVFKKICRMRYWMPKLKNINPYLLPDPLPDSIRELARLALQKMTVDKRTKIEEYDTEQLEGSADKTWIMSAQSPVQRKLIEEHPEDKAIYVEGPSLVWLRKISMSYYVLCSDPKTYPVVEEDEDDVSNLSLYMFGDPKPKSLVCSPKSVHEQEDATILGMCCTGTSSKDSVLSWVRFLQKSNPKLESIPILFKIRTSPAALVSINIDKKLKSENTTEEETPEEPEKS